MFNQSDFGKRVKEFRTRKNYSQKEIALRIGVSEQAVSKWENGDCLPDIYNLKLWRKCFTFRLIACWTQKCRIRRKL